MSLRREDLAGAWELERFTITFPGQEDAPLFPFGEDAQGQLVYAAGRMAAVLCRADREPLGVESLERAGRASEAAQAAAFSSYVSYAGTYRVEGQRVIHEVTHSLVPETVGAAHVREVELEGDRLVLSYELTPASGVTRRYRLAWTRSS